VTLKEIKKCASELKLLYVEDDVNARVSTLEMLKNLFHDITVATNGEDGLRAFENNTIDIVITDINMPGLNGIEMIEKIRAIDTKVAIFILSAHNDNQYFLDAIRLGIDGFIIKPLIFKQFINSLEKTLEKIHLDRLTKNYQKHLEEEIQKRTKELEQKLYYDDLTGLLNRYSFFEDVKKLDTPIVFMVDINDFKTINEIYGTDVGSQVLREFAKFLKDFASAKEYHVYRLSADEFIILDESKHIDYEKYERLLKEFFTQLNDFKVESANDTITIEVTVGISTSQHDAFECATIALEYAKKHKKSSMMYSSAIDRRSRDQNALVWKDRIKSAIAKNNIVAVYQGIVNKRGEVVKYETLMRIKNEDGELITPYHFLEISIKTRLYARLSSVVIFEGLKTIHRLHKSVTLNFTYSDIRNQALVEEIELYLKAYSDIGPLMVMEITESESIQNFEDIQKFIKRFKKYGVKFAIDDFGSGFSNFEHILEIEPDFIKIDGSLIKNIDKDEKSFILVKAIVGFSHQLGIKVIAEYVHSKEVFEILKSLDVDEYQGFYFYQPQETIEL